jgi:hypothetical protein
MEPISRAPLPLSSKCKQPKEPNCEKSLKMLLKSDLEGNLTERITVSPMLDGIAFISQSNGNN